MKPSAACRKWRPGSPRICRAITPAGQLSELEQCVRNVIIRRSYKPLADAAPRDNDFRARFQAGRATADEVLSSYAAHVYALTGSFEEPRGG